VKAKESNIVELRSMVETNNKDLTVKSQKVVDFKNDLNRFKEEKD
jgi:hypothetical protein